MSKNVSKTSLGSSRGREARHPHHIDVRGWRDITLRIKDKVLNDNLGLIAAGVAFYFLLALFPLISAFLSIYGLIFDPEEAREHVSHLVGVMPEESRRLVTRQTDELTTGSDSALGLGALVSIVIALWIARRGVNAMIIALNIAYGEDDDRNLIHQLLLSLALTLGLILFFILSLAIVAAAPLAFQFLGLRPAAEAALDLLRWPILGLLVVMALAVMYRFAPDRRYARWRWLTPGAVLSVILWLIASGLFSWYVSNFGNYNETYGSLGAVVILLLWFYLTAYAFLLGAELNSEMEHQTGEDTTTGDDQPMGERGAFVADDLGKKP
ncbi:MAG: YihY/virulence factor BrkB family protein [Marinobacter sp.]